MAASEIKAGLRIFYREKSYAFINLAGLSLAIACCLILGLYLKSELTYDQHHLRYKQIFRVANEFAHSGPPDRMAMTPIPLGPMLKKDYPEVRDYVRFARAEGKMLIRSGDKSFYWDHVYNADPSVFNVFTHNAIYGDPKTALMDPTSAVVSETFARKYFGDSNPVGQTIHAETGREMVPRKITLVFRDLPENTHLKYDVLFRFIEPPNSRQMLFGVSLFTYLLMPENYRAGDFEAINRSFFSKYMEDFLKTSHSTWRSWLEPLADIHLHSDLMFDLPAGNRYYVYGFAAVAAFILLVACLNYVNLAVARSLKRAKEIGMRKILGSSRTSLLFRFFGESMLFSLVAMVFGFALVELALKFTPLNDLLGKHLEFRVTSEPVVILWIFGLGILIGLLSGIYPALCLSSLSPLSALAGPQRRHWTVLSIRELLVLIQFTVSAIVIACTLFMTQQMHYLSSKPLGFGKQNRVLIDLHGFDITEKYELIKNDLLKDSHIKGISASSQMISTGQMVPSSLGMVANKDGNLEATSFYYIRVKEDFLDAMGIKVISGRDFSKKLLTDMGTSFVVNESMVRARGWKDPIGKRIELGPYRGGVIGVVKDFHFKSLHSPMEPFAMWLFNDQDFRNTLPLTMVVSVAENELQPTLGILQQKFAQYDPRHPFEYALLDDSIDKLYLSEQRLMKMTGVFSAICIFISCLGLFGLAAFSTEQRSKEIGIRKVLGASAGQIITMLARKTLLLVLASSVAASIMAYFAIDEWMAGFAYRVGINPAIFLVSAAIVIAVAFITIALQSYKTAQANPASTIRYE